MITLLRFEQYFTGDRPLFVNGVIFLELMSLGRLR